MARAKTESVSPEVNIVTPFEFTPEIRHKIDPDRCLEPMFIALATTSLFTQLVQHEREDFISVAETESLTVRPFASAATRQLGFRFKSVGMDVGGSTPLEAESFAKLKLGDTFGPGPYLPDGYFVGFKYQHDVCDFRDEFDRIVLSVDVSIARPALYLGQLIMDSTNNTEPAII